MNLICGINPVLEALNAGSRSFDRVLVVKGLRNRRIADAISRASRLGVPLRFEGRDTLDRLAGGLQHQGIIAVVSEKPMLALDELLQHVRDPALLMVLDGVEDPRNLGAVMRTCEAAGADGVVLPQRHSAGLSETVGRTSAGALEYVRVAKVGNLAQALEALKARGIWVVGFDASGSVRWDQVDLRQPVALVMGGEGRGMRRLVRERCDIVASLPLFGHVASLNVSVAAGIALYETVRQRGRVPSHVRPIPSAAAAGLSTARIVGPELDDGEQDPGQLAPRTAPRRDDMDEDDQASDTPLAVVLLDEEDAAWAAGPTMLRSKPHTRGRLLHTGGSATGKRKRRDKGARGERRSSTRTRRRRRAIHRTGARSPSSGSPRTR